MKSIHYIITFIFLIILGCSEEDSTVNPPVNNIDSSYFPLELGNMWIYKDYNSIIDTLLIPGGYSLNGYFINNFGIYFKESNDYWFFGLCGFRGIGGLSDGLSFKEDSLFVFQGDYPYLTKYLLIPPNPYVGRVDTVYHDILNEMVELETKALNEVVNINAGTFNCLRMTVKKGSTNYYELWFSRGVGIVKIQLTPTHKVELQSYYLR